MLFSAAAVDQKEDDTELVGEALTELVDKLMEVLTAFIPNEDQVTAIVEKWDAREDLSENTRSRSAAIRYEQMLSPYGDHTWLLVRE